MIEVKFTVNKGNGFWEFDNCPFDRGWPLNRGPLNRGLTVLGYGIYIGHYLSWHDHIHYICNKVSKINVIIKVKHCQ